MGQLLATVPGTDLYVTRVIRLRKLELIVVSGQVTGELYIDQVSFGGLTANQVIGSATGNSPIPASGIVGFSGQIFSQFPNSTNATPFIQTLCNQSVVTECRFGLALTESGSGTLTLGELDTSLYTGDLVVAPIIEAWALTGDLAINGKVVINDLLIELDSGTATIVGYATDYA
jgi:pepsin A